MGRRWRYSRFGEESRAGNKKAEVVDETEGERRNKECDPRERETAGMAVRKIVKEGFWPRRYPHTVHATPSKRQKTETFVEHSNTILFSEENCAKHLLCPRPPSSPVSLSLSFSRSRGTKGDKVSARYEYEGEMFPAQAGGSRTLSRFFRDRISNGLNRAKILGK